MTCREGCRSHNRGLEALYIFVQNPSQPAPPRHLFFPPARAACMGCAISHAPRAEIYPDRVVPRGARRQTSSAVATASGPIQLPPGYALLFAVDAYLRVVPLQGAVADAEHLRAVLERLGFVVLRAVYDDACTPDEVERVLRDTAETLPTAARLLVFFAGHGLRHTTTRRVFYATHATDPSALLSTGFDLQRLHALRDFLPKHQLFVFDFCYSGAATVRSRSQYADFASPSVQFMSAGAAEEQVGEVDTLTFLSHSPLCTPFATPSHSPKSGNSSDGSTEPTFDSVPDRLRQLSVPAAPIAAARRIGGIFASTLTGVLTAVANLHARQTAHGTVPRRISATEVFLRVRRKVLSTSKRYGLQQTPQIERSPFWRDCRCEGEFLF